MRRWALPGEIQVLASETLAPEDSAADPAVVDDDPPFVRTLVHGECPTVESEDPKNACFATGVAFSSDGSRLASTGRDGVIRL